ncbi:MAG: phosphohydrolase [Candidatus Dactylopiibacterium carminicum]|nr:MAG: phosphohydrolase [Candidatus Dactylopiibacterium carminicum]
MMRARMEQELVGLFTMAWMVEARDPFTVGHAWRVSRYARLIAEGSVQTEQVIAQVAVAGYLHDLGKVGISDAVLTRPERLIESEYEMVKEHSAGLKGLEIPLPARIIAVCDAFDAMTSQRPYRRALSLNEALNHIERGLGSQFDAEFGARFVSLGRAGGFDHILGHSDIGIRVQSCPNCGPVVNVFRTHEDGDSVYCRLCANEFKVRRSSQGVDIEPTGNKGRPSVAVALPDTELISRLILDAVGHLES